MKHSSEPSRPGFQIRNLSLALAALLVLTLAMFWDALFNRQQLVLSQPGTDLFREFIHWRRFGFEELRHGNLALWNPHNFSGAPFFGGFQSALLYPPNFVYLILPIDKAVNFGIVLHVFLTGAFMYLWAANRGLRPIACFFSGALLMFCGAHFLHIFAGHLSHLCTMIWAPLLFLAIDRMFARPSLGAGLLGAFAIAMQILAGHPQYVFYNAVAAAIYSALYLIKSPARGKIVLGLVAMCAGGIALSAVQLLTGLQALGETLRSIGLSRDFAASFSFPPENFLTLLAPTFFGNMKAVPYWGRWYLWEMSLFIGITGFALAIYGCIAGERRVRRFSFVMLAVLLVLALGAYTPLFDLLYRFVPGFNKFRGSSKFIFVASTFLILLAGIGLDKILQAKQAPLKFIIGLGTAALLVGICGLVINESALSLDPSSLWYKIVWCIPPTNETYLTNQFYSSPEFIMQTGRYAAVALFVAAGTLLLIAFLFWMLKFSRHFACGIVALGILEVVVFARGSIAKFELRRADSPEIKKFLAEHPGDYRIVDTLNPNSGISMGADDIWGEDPGGALLRYAQFLTFTQGGDPAQASQYLRFTDMSRLLRLVRTRYAFITHGGKVDLAEGQDFLPRLLLVQKYRVLKQRDEIFAALKQESFNLSGEVILESEPEPKPGLANQKGTAKLVESTTDHFTVEADVPSPAILFITDAYSEHWRARATGGDQREYRIMPADYCLRAVPLSAGRHRIRFEYLPGAFVIGKWISLAGVLGYVALAVWLFWKPRG